VFGREQELQTSAIADTKIEMTRARTFTIAAVAFVCIAAAAPLVTYESPCECRDNHGKHRWVEKNDPALPPTEASAIQAVTPSDIFNWLGPTEYLVGTAMAETEGTATAITGYRKSNHYRGDAANKWRLVQKLLLFEIVRVLMRCDHVA
jgi:hypothetical protein